MADPQFDEHQILEMLAVPASLAMIDPLQMGAIMATIDTWDRKVLRDPFMELTAHAFALHSNLGRLRLLDFFNTAYTKNQLSPANFAESKTQLLAFCETERVMLRSRFELVAKCPTSNDKIS